MLIKKELYLTSLEKIVNIGKINLN